MVIDGDGHHDLLAACEESVRQQIALIAQLAATWQMEPTDVYYDWCLHRPRADIIPGTAWRYMFHGLECDMTHQSDGRFVRIEFGPGGRADCLSPYSVLQFIMTSKPPWGHYPVLQAQLADGPPPFTQLSGDFRRICAMLEPFYEANLIIQADPELYHLQEQWSTIEPSGSTHIRPQPPYDNPYDRPFWDMAVCHRMVLAPSGSRIARGAMDEGARMGDLDDDYWQRVHNQPLWHRYPSLYEQVLAILVAADPIGICDGGERRAAYTPEVNTILPRLKEAQSPDDLIRIVREELIVWFGATAVRQDGSKGIGRTLWDLIQQPHHQAEIQTIPPGDAAGLKASGAAPNTLP